MGVMRILVCVKRVPAPGARIIITEDEQNIDSGHLGFTMSPHEECAIEAATQLAERYGGEVTILTAGSSASEEQLRYAASVGASALVLIENNTGSDWDPQHTARALSAAVRTLENESGDFDLLLFGNEAADTGGYQTGIRAAHLLGHPIVNGINGIDVEEEGFVARRETMSGVEVYRVPKPAAFGVKEGITLPRYPTMKGRLASKKLSVRVIEDHSKPGQQCRLRLLRPAEVTKETVILGTDSNAALAVVDLLEEMGLV
jgi:electron transfer flavoprotein beta subunit